MFSWLVNYQNKTSSKAHPSTISQSKYIFHIEVISRKMRGRSYSEILKPFTPSIQNLRHTIEQVRRENKQCQRQQLLPNQPLTARKFLSFPSDKNSSLIMQCCCCREAGQVEQTKQKANNKLQTRRRIHTKAATIFGPLMSCAMSVIFCYLTHSLSNKIGNKSRECDFRMQILLHLGSMLAEC